MVVLPDPNSPPGLLVEVPWLDAVFACPKSPPAGAVVVGVVLEVVVFGVEDVLPNRLVPVPVGVTAGVLPNKPPLAGGFDEPPKRLPLVPPPREGVDEPGVALLAAPKSDFCSPGLAPALANKLPPEAPEEAVVLPLAPPGAFPKEKAPAGFDWLPKRPPDVLVMGVVDEPNSPPLLGALEVVALLLDCPEELEAPKENDIAAELECSWFGRGSNYIGRDEVECNDSINCASQLLYCHPRSRRRNTAVSVGLG